MAAKSVVITDYRTQLPGKVDPDDPSVYMFDQITSEHSHGKKMYWRIIVRLVADHGKPTERFLPLLLEYFDSKTELPAGAAAWLKVVSKTGDDGKIRDVTPDVVSEGRNRGKANQTNAFTQGLRDALSKHNAQLKKTKCAEPAVEGDQADTFKLYPPMLAQDRKNVKKRLDFTEELYVQPKYNGVRVVSVMNDDSDVLLYSRKRNLYPSFGYIEAELSPIFDHYYNEWSADDTFGGTLYIDGEIYRHGVNLQDIAGVARNEQKALTLHYYVYDLFIPERPLLTYPERKRLLDTFAARFANSEHVRFAETQRVTGEDALGALYRRFRAEGYEGAMVRPPRPYRYSYNDYHSDSLLKMKPKEDAEFTITGYEGGKKGKSAGTLIMVVRTDGGVSFNVTMGRNISIEQAKEMYRKMGETEANGKTHFENRYLGKRLTVEYEELSKDGVPLRAKTRMVIRDYE